jgi:flagellar biosynthesis/type III secretory pathway M-ring protein FliF/YscJ
MLRFIPGVMVSVHVDVNLQKKQAVSHRFDPQVIQKETKVTSDTEESVTAQPSSQEPGAMPNVGMVATPASNTGNTTNSEHTTTEFQNFAGDTTETIVTPAGEATVTAASVRVPRSYFVSIYKSANPDDQKDPDETKLQPLVIRELGKIRADVKACTGLKTDDAITVETYMDPMASTNNEPAPPASAGIPVMITSNVRQIAVGALAVAALFMVMMMVRKSAPPQVKLPEPEPEEEPRRLDAAETLVGEATENPPALDGMEIDEGALKAQQMLKQVQSMVEENPDAAANLVKRWLNRT